MLHEAALLRPGSVIIADNVQRGPTITWLGRPTIIGSSPSNVALKTSRDLRRLLALLFFDVLGPAGLRDALGRPIFLFRAALYSSQARRSFSGECLAYLFSFTLCLPYIWNTFTRVVEAFEMFFEAYQIIQTIRIH